MLFFSAMTLHSQERIVGIAESPARNLDEKIQAEVVHLLEKKVFPEIKVVNSSLSDAISIIQNEAVEYEGPVVYTRRGISFVIEGVRPEKKISFSGTNVYFGRALEEICLQSEMLWTIRENAIYLSKGKRFTHRESPYKGTLK